MNEAKKFDVAKDPWHLLPTDALRCVVRVLSFGAVKYGARNWERGMDWSRCYAAAQRHLAAWWEGEKTDPETGYSHLWHAGCCVMFLIAYEQRKIGVDDRPRIDGQGDEPWDADSAVKKYRKLIEQVAGK